MPVRTALIAVAFSLLLGSAAPVVAATPPTPVVPGEYALSIPIDLAALMLVPDDIDIPGGNFGYETGRYTAVEDTVGTITSLTGGEAEPIRAELVLAGWRQGYFARIASPSGNDPSLAGYLVYSGVTRYASAAGASIGYRLLADAYVDGGYVAARDETPIGDVSTVTRSRISNVDGSMSQVLNAIFRTGPFVVHYFLVDGADEPPPITLAAELGEVLLDRIQRSERDPGLSNRTLVLTGEGVQTSWAVYRRLEGAQIAQFRQSPASVRSDQEFFGEANVISRFHQRQVVPVPGNADDFVEFALVVNQFEDADSALIALSDWSNGEANTPTAGFSAVTVVTDGASHGDVSRTYAFAFDRGEPGVATGYRYYIQTGPVLVVFHVMSLAGLELAAADSLALAVTECAAEAAGCDPLDVPADLLEGSAPVQGSSLA